MSWFYRRSAYTFKAMDEPSTIPDEVKCLNPNVASMLQNIQPSIADNGLRLYPCEVQTDDGVTHRRVYVVNAKEYIRYWCEWPWIDTHKMWLPAERIQTLKSSRDRLPVSFANTLYAAGESGMGYCAFSVELHDRRQLYYITGNAVDFLCWPSDVGPEDVISVHPHVRRPARWWTSFKREEGADYMWCPYRPSREGKDF